jgi:hypothetical protein
MNEGFRALLLAQSSWFRYFRIGFNSDQSIAGVMIELTVYLMCWQLRNFSTMMAVWDGLKSEPVRILERASGKALVGRFMILFVTA